MKLWIDDVRPKPDDFDLEAKTFAHAIKLLRKYKVTFISFDHDLGEEKSGYDIARWIEEKAFNNEISKINWQVHSANPIGRDRIILAMKNAEKYWKNYNN